MVKQLKTEKSLYIAKPEVMGKKPVLKPATKNIYNISPVG